MRAHTDFQSQIDPLPKFDLFVCLLWARLGSRLHPSLHQKPGGGEYASGTEYELLDAMEGFLPEQGDGGFDLQTARGIRSYGEAKRGAGTNPQSR